MSKKPIVLCILDGYGLNERKDHNAVAMANRPVMENLLATCPHVKGNASGMAVGLPDGQMGNSEVGHLNMGAGRIVYQELTRITKEIQDGDFFKNPELMAAMENCKKKGSALHAFGLLSDGGVHSHNTHLYGLLEMAKRNGLEKVYVHCFLDGRDTPPTSGKEFVKALEEEFNINLSFDKNDELIRCKECKYCIDYCRIVDGYETKYACKLKREQDGLAYRISEDDFCSKAEPKETGE